MLMPRMQPIVALPLLLAFLSGCGGPKGPQLGTVTGKVTVDGKPVSKVSITFTPEDPKGSPSYGGTNANGQYTLLFSQDRKGAMVGKHKVQIVPASVEIGDDGKPVGTQEIPTIPQRYQKTGTLSAEVKPGSNTLHFELESKLDAEDKPAKKR